MLTENKEKVQSLLQRYYDGSLDGQEAAELAVFLQDNQYDGLAQETLAAIAAGVQPVAGEEEAMQRMLQRVKDVSNGPAKVRPMWKRMAVAAVLAGAVALAWYQFAGTTTGKQMARRQYQNDVMPGANRATLTLADGSVVDLEKALNGQVAQQGGSHIVKNGEDISYYGSEAAGAIQYNTLATPRGGQFKLMLPDGTVVWLNAASSLRYPTAFAGNTRTVELSGEAYFEVAKNAAMPFVVTLADASQVEVLGTSFNVSAYNDESTQATTLVEGAVRVRRGTVAEVLKPGQQALTVQGDLSVNNKADVAAVTAWKNGQFLFNDTDIETVMKQLARWYNIEVVYENGPVKEYFNGTIPRNAPLSQVLELLELTELVHFKIEGNKVTVTPP
ncbi:FecR family protein [uncultured Chitinophaga sp.]|uniref:FecR family protein n=1 Tax=uncultured Chitinophaga sp. TaxID=339340 RepID=UPI0025D4015B|nr:FecR family protein [uncultured Chitinophaga sp.]